MTRGGHVAVVHLRRPGALGVLRRVEAWEAIAAASGRTCTTLDVAALGGRPEPSRLSGVLSGDLVPEVLTWSRRALRDALRSLSPDLVVFVTARTYDAGCVPPGADVVLDFVDRLSENYRLRRTAHASPFRRVAYTTLARSMRRFECASHGGARRTAAGWSDAQRLSATWIPNVHLPAQRTAPPLASDSACYDLLFHGTLRYEPNVEAVLSFRGAWEQIRRRRPDATMLVAGAQPPRHLAAAIAAVPGWTLMPDFPSLPALMRRTRLAVAPLVSATGFQNKVLETAAYGVPQVVSPAARRGLDPDFPVVSAGAPQEWADAIVALLEDPAAASALGQRAQDHVRTSYCAERFASWL